MEIALKDLPIFITLSWILIITPGPDIVYVITKGVSQGKKAGINSALGVAVGILVHTILAALGLSVILKTSILAFTVIKLFGAAYLVFLGLKSILASANTSAEKPLAISGNRHFLQGVFCNVLNPKVAIFFMAFLPQFVDTAQNSSPALGMIMLGSLFFGFTLLFLLTLALLSSQTSSYLNSRPGFAPLLTRISGIIMILLGVRLAFMQRN